MKTFLNVIGLLALLGGLGLVAASSTSAHEIEAGISWLLACSALGLAKVIEL